MDLGEEAVSGPDVQDNAGKADPVTLDDVITASLDGVEGKGEEPSTGKKKATKSDGDESGSEDAPAGDPGKAEAAEEGADKVPHLDAPKHWPDDRKRAFAALPREGREAMLRLAKDLEGGFTRKSQEIGDKAKFADSVRGLFEDSERSLMQRSGLDEVGALKHLVELNRFAAKDPVGYLKWTMQQLKVSPDQLVAQEKQPGQTEDLEALLEDPKVKQLEAKLSQLENFINESQTQQRLSVTNSIKSTIDNFRTEQDEHGQLKYPHFDAVQRHMGALMDTDPELSQLPDGPEKLQKAYDMAVWARPDLRQSFLEAEATRRAQDAEKKREAERAKRAVGAKPPSGAPTVRPKGGSLDDALDAALSKAGL